MGGLLALTPLCLLAALGVLSPGALACNGYKLLVKKVESKCSDGKPTIFQLNGFNVSMDQNCIVRPAGCAKLTHGFKTAQVTYVLKSPLGMTLMRDTRDGCAAMEKAADNPQLLMMLTMFNLPTNCKDVTPRETCGDGHQLDFTPLKNHLRIGSLKGDVSIKHDGGMFSCVQFELTVKK